MIFVCIQGSNVGLLNQRTAAAPQMVGRGDNCGEVSHTPPSLRDITPLPRPPPPSLSLGGILIFFNTVLVDVL